MKSLATKGLAICALVTLQHVAFANETLTEEAGATVVATQQPDWMAWKANLSEYEQRIWDLSVALDEEMARKGRFRRDPALQNYVQSVLDRLFPEYQGQWFVRILTQPEVNAFATAAGHIYITEGLLARLENEAQLATVLGHEGAHVLLRHASQSAEFERMGETAVSMARSLVNSANPVTRMTGGNITESVVGAARATVVERARSMADDMVLVTAKHQFELVKARVKKAIHGSFTGMRPEGFSATSIFGFTGGMEREADRLGYERMVAAGYDPLQAIQLFKLLGDEMQRRNKSEFFFFSAIDRLNDREASFKESLALSQPSTIPELEDDKDTVRLGDQAFNQRISPVLQGMFELEVASGRYEALLNFLTSEVGQRKIQRYPLLGYFYLAEAYRVRSLPGDDVLAEQAYRKVLEMNPEHFQALRAMAMLSMRSGNRQQAQDWLLQSWLVCSNQTDCSMVAQMATDR